MPNIIWTCVLLQAMVLTELRNPSHSSGTSGQTGDNATLTASQESREVSSENNTSASKYNKDYVTETSSFKTTTNEDVLLRQTRTNTLHNNTTAESISNATSSVQDSSASSLTSVEATTSAVTERPGRTNASSVLSTESVSITSQRPQTQTTQHQNAFLPAAISEVIVDVKMRLSAMTWHEDYANMSSAKAQAMSRQLTQTLTNQLSAVTDRLATVRVVKLSPGSVIVESQVTVNGSELNAQNHMEVVLANATANGTLGNLTVDTSSLIVSVLQCVNNPPSAPVNAQRIWTGSTMHGSVASYVCDQGFTMRNASNLEVLTPYNIRCKTEANVTSFASWPARFECIQDSSTSSTGNPLHTSTGSESTTPGSTTFGSTTSGSTTSGSTTSGSTTSGSTTSGSTTSGATTSGSTTFGSTTSGSTTPGSTTEVRPMPATRAPVVVKKVAMFSNLIYSMTIPAAGAILACVLLCLCCLRVDSPLCRILGDGKR